MKITELTLVAFFFFPLEETWWKVSMVTILNKDLTLVN